MFLQLHATRRLSSRIRKMAEKFQGKYRIASTRAKWHHYNDGAYFITINTAFREHYFGKIADNKMIFSEFGKFLDDQIVHIKEHYPYAEIPVHQVMPNHVHLIILLIHRFVETWRATS